MDLTDKIRRRSESRLLFHGTTLRYLNDVISKQGLYLPAKGTQALEIPKVHLTHSLGNALHFSSERAAEYRAVPVVLCIDKSKLVDCNLDHAPDYSFYTCDFLRPEWFKSYECSLNPWNPEKGDGAVHRKISEDFKEILSTPLKLWL